MSLRVNTNVEAFNAHRNLAQTSTALSKSMEKLSSGLRINRAADDAAGLAISEKMRAQIRGTRRPPQRAGRHLARPDGGRLAERDPLDPSAHPRARRAGRQRHAGDNDLAQITAEVAQLTAELVRIRDASTFNGIALFSSSADDDDHDPGRRVLQNLDSANNTNRVGISMNALDFSTISMDVTQIDTAIASVSTVRSDLGAKQNRLETRSTTSASTRRT